MVVMIDGRCSKRLGMRRPARMFAVLMRLMAAMRRQQRCLLVLFCFRTRPCHRSIARR